jgi:hypothetical protein
MPNDESADTVREAVGYFDTAEALQEAVDALLSSGFDRAELSFLADERTVDQKLGDRYRKVTELEDEASVPRCCYVSTESIGDAEGALIGAPLYLAGGAAAGAVVASGGTLAVAVGAAAIAGGAGALFGSLLAKMVGEHHARYLQEQLDHGGLLLWVRTRDAEREKRASDILKKHSGKDVHVHALPA